MDSATDPATSDLTLVPEPRARVKRVTWALALTWVALHLLGLNADGWKLEGNVFTWGSVSDATLVRHGALVPALVNEGEVHRLVTGSGTVSGGMLAGGVLPLLLALWVLTSTAGALEVRAGSARAGLVLLAAGLAAAGLRTVWFFSGSASPQAMGWDVVLGAVGAQVPWGIARGGREGRVAVSAAFAFVALSIVLVMVPAGGAWWMLAGQGAGFVAGALALTLLGPRRVDRPPGAGVKGLALLGLLVVLLAAGLQARQALADPGAAKARRVLTLIEDVEREARRLWNAPNPAKVPRAEREAFGERLDAARSSPDLEDLDGAAELRAYVESMRPLATGDLRDPTAVLPRLKAAYARWEPHERKFLLKHGERPRSQPPWR